MGGLGSSPREVQTGNTVTENTFGHAPAPSLLAAFLLHWRLKTSGVGGARVRESLGQNLASISESREEFWNLLEGERSQFSKATFRALLQFPVLDTN